MGQGQSAEARQLDKEKKQQQKAEAKLQKKEDKRLKKQAKKEAKAAKKDAKRSRKGSKKRNALAVDESAAGAGSEPADGPAMGGFLQGSPATSASRGSPSRSGPASSASTQSSPRIAWSDSPGESETDLEGLDHMSPAGPAATSSPARAVQHTNGQKQQHKKHQEQADASKYFAVPVSEEDDDVAPRKANGMDGSYIGVTDEQEQPGDQDGYLQVYDSEAAAAAEALPVEHPQTIAEPAAKVDVKFHNSTPTSERAKLFSARVETASVSQLPTPSKDARHVTVIQPLVASSPSPSTATIVKDQPQLVAQQEHLDTGATTLPVLSPPSPENSERPATRPSWGVSLRPVQSSAEPDSSGSSGSGDSKSTDERGAAAAATSWGTSRLKSTTPPPPEQPETQAAQQQSTADAPLEFTAMRQRLRSTGSDVRAARPGRPNAAPPASSSSSLASASSTAASSDSASTTPSDSSSSLSSVRQRLKSTGSDFRSARPVRAADQPQSQQQQQQQQDTAPTSELSAMRQRLRSTGSDVRSAAQSVRPAAAAQEAPGKTSADDSSPWAVKLKASSPPPQEPQQSTAAAPSHQLRPAATDSQLTSMQAPSWKPSLKPTTGASSDPTPQSSTSSLPATLGAQPTPPATSGTAPAWKQTLKPASSQASQSKVAEEPMKLDNSFSDAAARPWAGGLKPVSTRKLVDATMAPTTTSRIPNIPASATASRAEPDDIPEDELEELDPKAIEAAKWMDKQIWRLIEEVKTYGTKSGNQTTVEYGVLFDKTANIFDALTGILKTAKKHGVLYFEGETLFQGVSDKVVIVLLKETHDAIKIKRRRKAQLKTADANCKSKQFGDATLQNQNSKCAVCHKTVYAMEFVGAADKAFHKACFRCLTCKCVLKPTDFCTVNDKFYCPTHYQQLFMQSTDYSAAEAGQVAA